MGNVNRRLGYRMPLQLFMNQHLKDRAHRCMAVNLSPHGIYLNRLVQQDPDVCRVVGLEFELPETSEVVWARGEARFEQLDPYFHGTGYEITGIARKHERLIRDYVLEHRSRQLRRLLALIRRNRMH
jgi:hypothetical protein